MTHSKMANYMITSLIKQCRLMKYIVTIDYIKQKRCNRGHIQPNPTLYKEFKIQQPRIFLTAWY